MDLEPQFRQKFMRKSLFFKASSGNFRDGITNFDNFEDGADEEARRMQCSSSAIVIHSRFTTYDTPLKNAGQLYHISGAPNIKLPCRIIM